MKSRYERYLSELLLFCLTLSNNSNLAATLKIPKAPNNTITAVLVFGDSTVDPGNNNFVDTVFRGNFPPYGKDFVNQEATGRFTNGLIVPDFIASYIGVKESVPPYLDPTLSIDDLMTGVSFASAGSGFDPLTPKISNVIDIPRQVQYFKDYKKRLESAIGKQKTEDHIRKALYIISAGTNDFVVNYFTLPIRPKTYSISDYQQFILEKMTQLIQELFDEGARRIVMTSLPPMGCLPVVITLFSVKPVSNRNCLDQYTSIGKDFNAKLRQRLDSIQALLATHGVKIGIDDAFSSLSDQIQGKKSSEFDEVNSGCCGTGYLEAGLLCHPKSFLCPDANKYVFWDSIHPTQQTYFNMFKSFRPVIDELIKD